MNERIRELLNEATVGLEPDLSPQRTVTLNELEKFAELIVKETITEMCQQLYWHGEDQSNNPSFYKAIDKTKKHFGVEE